MNRTLNLKVPVVIMFILVTPDYTAGTFTCSSTLPTVPSGILMAENTSQPEIMCPGQKARYICASPGINIREVKL
jgi:hypothetical protein